MLHDTLQTFLKHFEQSVRDGGDEELARYVRSIQELPDPVNYVRKLLTKRKRPQRPDISLNQRQAWLKNYTSPELGKLSEEEAASLAHLTCGWELDNTEVRDLAITATFWSQNPGNFWGGEADSDILRKIVSGYRHEKTVQPVSKRVTFIVAYEEVRDRQKALIPSKRQRKTSKSDEGRPARCLRLSLRELGSEIWKGKQKDEIKRNISCLASVSLWGWKYSQLKHRGFILSLSEASLKRFERGQRSQLQFDAITAWIETTPQFGIIGILNKAYDYIVHWYRNGSLPTNHDSPATSTHVDDELFCGANDHDNTIEVQDNAGPTYPEASRSNSSEATPRVDDGTAHVAQILTHMSDQRSALEESVPPLNDGYSNVTTPTHVQASLVDESEHPRKRLCIEENPSQTSNRLPVHSQVLPLAVWSALPSPVVPDYHDETRIPASGRHLETIQNPHHGLAQPSVTYPITQLPYQNNLASLGNSEVTRQSFQAIATQNLSQQDYSSFLSETNGDAPCRRAEGIGCHSSGSRRSEYFPAEAEPANSGLNPPPSLGDALPVQHSEVQSCNTPQILAFPTTHFDEMIDQYSMPAFPTTHFDEVIEQYSMPAFPITSYGEATYISSRFADSDDGLCQARTHGGNDVFAATYHSNHLEPAPISCP